METFTTETTALSGIFLPNWLEHRARAVPDQLALLAAGSRWTFAELDRRTAAMARKLVAHGARPGDRVGLLLANSPEFAMLAHAAPRIGIALVPLNTRLAAPELAWQMADAGARMLLYDSHHASPAGLVLSLLADRLPRSDAVLAADVAAFPDPPEPGVALRGSIDLSDMYTIIYTSGTTGQPKGAMLTYGNYWWSAIGSALNLGNHDHDRWLAVLPLFHVGGLAIVVRGAIYGIPAVVHQTFDPAAVNRAIDEEGVTIVSVVSVMLRRMLDERGARPYPPTLRCVLLGGGPAPRPLLEACAKQGVPVMQTYGLTEAASQVATLSPLVALEKLGSAGQPLLPTALQIDRSGAPAGAGQVGEILVHGPTVMRGYVNRPDETARALRSGWLHTGDLGYLDDEGYLYVVSRRDDLIISGGENIYPAEIEATLLAHPAIEEAGVVGLPDQHWGQIPVACVKLRPGMTLSEAEVIAFCREQLAAYKVPKRLCLVEALPRNAAGKPIRAAMRALFAAARPDEAPIE